MAREQTFFCDMAALRELAATGSPEQQLAAFQRMVEAIGRLERVDVTFYEAGCDCCSGEYERRVDSWGEYVVADRITEVLAATVQRRIKPGELSLKP